MIRKAFLMKVYKEFHDEYKQRHDDIWPEMKCTLKNHGVHNYSVFLEPKTNMLVGYVEVESEEQWNDISQTETCQSWWNYMKDIMETNPDNSPTSTELQHIFYLE